MYYTESSWEVHNLTGNSFVIITIRVIVAELTFSCYHRLPLLTNDLRRTELCHAIDRAAERHNWVLSAFVLMPEHVHLLVYPLCAEAKIDSLLFAIKRLYSYRIKQYLIKARSPLLDQLPLQQRPGVTTSL